MQSSEHHYKIIVSYDGTDFKGWQRQPHKNTITDQLERSFKQAFKQSITLRGASRTDSGVHALGQVATFTTRVSLHPDMLHSIWHKNMPLSIRICSIALLHHSHDPRANVALKEYRYHFFTDRPCIFKQRFGYHVRGTVDLTLLVQALKLFEGVHDFTSFCKKPAHGTTIRRVASLELVAQDQVHAYSIIITAKSFLHNMIRRIVGACLQVARHEKTLDSIVYALDNPNHQQEFLNAPACGLVLYCINYLP